MGGRNANNRSQDGRCRRDNASIRIALPQRNGRAPGRQDDFVHYDLGLAAVALESLASFAILARFPKALAQRTPPTIVGESSDGPETMIETLEVKTRDAVGTSRVQKLRATGLVPAVLYGHGETNINLAIAKDAVNNIVRHGTKMLALTGAVQDTALLREVQWDAFGIEILHVDLTRVSRDEAVEITLPVELHGEAPGLSEGGQLKFTTHELAIRCPAGSIPEHLMVSVANLHLGQSVHASDVVLPEGASMITPAAVVIVQIAQPMAEGEEEAGAVAEPEVIGKDKESDKK
jgi:large subunit ribosomal protein L25